MAAKTVAGNFGGFLQVDDERLMTSQLSVNGLSPPKISSLEKPLNKRMKSLGNNMLGQFKMEKPINKKIEFDVRLG